MNESTGDNRDYVDVTDSQHADVIYQMIDRLAGIRRQSVHGPFLGLGAGLARAEERLASLYDIGDVVLVDQQVGPSRLIRGTYVQSDIFSFLQTDQRKFGLITALGMEYVFQHEKYWESFWNGLSRVTKPGSVVVVRPNNDIPIPFGSPFSEKLSGPTLIAQR